MFRAKGVLDEIWYTVVSRWSASSASGQPWAWTCQDGMTWTAQHSLRTDDDYDFTIMKR